MMLLHHRVISMKWSDFFKIVLAFAVFVGTFASLPLSGLTASAETKSTSKSLAEYVDTLYGTDNNAGSTSAGPTMPNGSVHPAPETLSTNSSGGYRKGYKVLGFGQMYAQGNGAAPHGGNFLLSPQTGVIKTANDQHVSSVSSETGVAHYYTAVLDAYGIKAELTPGHNTAFYRFTYPSTTDSSFIIDVSRYLKGGEGMSSGSVTVDAENNMIYGGGNFNKSWSGVPYKMYFALSFDHAFSEVGTWDDKGLNSSALTLTKDACAEHFGAYVKFDTTSNQVVNVKIAISYESLENAKNFLKEEGTLTFDQAKANAEAAWNEVLGAVELGEGVTEEQKKMFYTCLYYTNIQPRDRTEDHGNWDDFFTIWDSWRTVFPFLQLTRPDMVADVIKSFVKRYDESGMISDAFIAGTEYLCGQGGNDVENIIADAFLKSTDKYDWEKLYGIDWQEVYETALAHANDYRSKTYISLKYHHSGTAQNGKGYSWRLIGSSATVGFAYNDYSIATMAKGLGDLTNYEKFFARSKYWLNNWDENLVSSDGFKGFIHKRNYDGTYAVVDPSKITGHDGTEIITEGYNVDFYEAGIWEGSYSPTFDLATLVEKMGGKHAYAQRLNHALTEGFINYANEPSFQTLWTLCSEYVERPDIATYWIQDYISKYTDRGFPGDEDNGAMSTLYMFMVSGFFPMSGTNDYYLHGTRLANVTYHLGTGNDLVIKGVKADGSALTDADIYVQSATWNGKALDVSKLTWEQIQDGGTLVFVMGDTASDWARAEDDSAAPSKVQNLKVDSSNLSVDGTVSLTWDAATDDTAVRLYKIYRSTSNNFALNDSTFLANAMNTNYSLEASTDVYYYAVVAEDFYGKVSATPAYIMVEAIDTEKPTFSGGITQDNRYSDVGLTRLSWPKATDDTIVSKYHVYRTTKQTDPLNEDSLIATVTDLYYMGTMVRGSCYYSVVAEDAFGNLSDPITLNVVSERAISGKSITDNIALSKTVSVSGTNSTEIGANALDGNNKTKWCCKGSQSSANPYFWLEVDLGDTYVINKWVVLHASQSGLSGEKSGYNTRDFKLQVKDSSGNWLTIDTVDENTDGSTTRYVETFEARYVRLYITQAADSTEQNITRIYEFQLYHEHSLGDWTGNALNHWKECECGEKSDKGDHADSDLDGKCDVCGFEGSFDDPDGPYAGDTSKAALWASILAVSGLGALLTFFRKKRTV